LFRRDRLAYPHARGDVNWSASLGHAFLSRKEAE
jgi:hypothetical protein